ncbi:MAG: 30S ribosomal protein S20 [Candidatus Spechtbacteria bacterium RIFCSPLOWO2_01_FULL_46_10]|uniref:Small ribosomal subunit protein bS20 n=1 Tax=Candidatus Spechtbacteria bacterium RIFCSPLOWO2_01_FULL_46_10 TaxID=1802163 RepID=A0A1G2HEZ9_9BACT|nr:MAG: 30S ribosomal protein S20 [Candidatus Spechtbacteria bacterium RIFCSPLOWO2_01_FULL_46_10]
MPNLKAAEKSLRQDAKRTARNRVYKNKIKSIIKEMDALVAAGKMNEAAKLLPAFYKAVDKAAKRNILHKRNASHKKALAAKRVSTHKEKIAEKK